MDSFDDDASSDASSMRPEHDPDVVPINGVSENEVFGDAPPGKIAITKVEVEEGDGNSSPPPPAQAEEGIINLDVEYISDLPKVKGRSILHHHIKQEKVVFVSLDLESGGERCGIVQLSAEILRPELDRAAGKVTKDVLASVKRDGTLYYPETNQQAI